MTLSRKQKKVLIGLTAGGSTLLALILWSKRVASSPGIIRVETDSATVKEEWCGQSTSWNGRLVNTLNQELNAHIQWLFSNDGENYVLNQEFDTHFPSGGESSVINYSNCVCYNHDFCSGTVYMKIRITKSDTGELLSEDVIPFKL